MATTYLTRTFASGGNRKKWTYSVWFKRSKIGHSEDSMLFQTYGSTYTYCPIQSDDTFRFQDGSGGNKITNRKLTDCNAWYHIVVAIDTDHVTADDRYKIYINGVRETSFSTSTNPSSGYEGEWNKATLMNIGRHSGGSSYYDGLMSHIHFCDGYQYAASDFGSTDATTGEWKINTSPSVSYGTTGFTILKDGNTITDQSANSNNWTLGAGTLTNTEDCPSDVFATWNNLHNGFESATYSCGNTKTTTGGSGKYTWNNSTLGMIAGKYYMELRWVSGGTDALFGITDRFSNNSTEELGNYATQYAYRNNGQIYNSNSGSAWGNTWQDGDVIGCALDMDNNKLYFSKNGTWENSGDPTSGATGTGAVSISASPQNGCYYFSICGYDDASMVFEANFGNGYLGTTAVTSAGTNASGIGIFEYDVPTGYSALSTKGLNK